MAARLGILAGGGRLPRLIVEVCRERGRELFVLAFEGQTDASSVAGAAHAWVRLGEAAAGLAALRAAGVEELVMAGHIARPSVADLRPDLKAARFLGRVGLKALGDDGLLRAVIGGLEREGFRVIGVDDVLGGLLAKRGRHGRHEPDEQAWSDVGRAISVARALGAEDVGQAAVVQQGIVLGVEAVEGTDALLERCGALRRAGPGGVLAKVKKPGQDGRVDLPTIGVKTVERAAAAGLRGIAVEAEATLVIDAEATIAAADAAGLFLVGVAAPR